MDMQGTPVGSTHKGTKNTTDPRAKNEIQEGTGPVASDSLAAESARSGGGFSENKDSEPLGVKGANSTFANEDTSGATTLPPSKDASSRPDEDYSPSGPGGAKYAEAPSSGQPKFPGKIGEQGYSGGSTAAKEAVSGGSGTYSTSKDDSSTSKDASSTSRDASSTNKGSSSTSNDSSSGKGEEIHLDPAPTYVQNVITNHGSIGDKPKGKDLHEGIEDGGKNASFDMRGEPGDEKDPGRASVKQFQTTTSAPAGAGPTQGGIGGDNEYKALNADEKLE
ncbi:hypothetical protein MMC30_008043 [Trapelia coarctata]|nr:hypothetical protein [Trapelia coarctata]